MYDTLLAAVLADQIRRLDADTERARYVRQARFARQALRREQRQRRRDRPRSP